MNKRRVCIKRTSTFSRPGFSLMVNGFAFDERPTIFSFPVDSWWRHATATTEQRNADVLSDRQLRRWTILIDHRWRNYKSHKNMITCQSRVCSGWYFFVFFLSPAESATCVQEVTDKTNKQDIPQTPFDWRSRLIRDGCLIVHQLNEKVCTWTICQHQRVIANLIPAFRLSFVLCVH